MLSADSAAYCLERAGRTTAGSDTLVVTGAAGTALSAGDLWAVWSDLERWPLWSPLPRGFRPAAQPRLPGRHHSRACHHQPARTRPPRGLGRLGRRRPVLPPVDVHPAARRRHPRQQHRGIRRPAGRDPAAAGSPPVKPRLPGCGRRPHRPRRRQQAGNPRDSHQATARPSRRRAPGTLPFKINCSWLTWRQPSRGCWPRRRRSSATSWTATAACTPARPAARGACPPATSRNRPEEMTGGDASE